MKKLLTIILLLAGSAAAQTKDLNPRGLASVTFANLGTPADGTIVYCSDCTAANPVASGGTGTVARRENGAWNGGGGAGGSGITQITGDATAGPGSGSQALTLATVNANTGSCGDSTHVCQVTLDGKGRATAAAAVSIAGGSGTASTLTDFQVAKTSGTVETIGGTCSSSAPCQIRIGSIIYSLTSSPTVTISGTSNTGTVYWYLTSNEILTVGHNTSTTLTCSAGCTVATGITGFPTDSVPLWQTTFTTNVWDAVTEAMDKRAVYSRTVTVPGSGISSSIDPSTGIQTLSTDSTVVPRYFTGTVSGIPATCTQGRDFFTATDVLVSFYCSATNTWRALNLIEQNSKSAAYTTVMSDAGRQIYHPSADTTARTFTIDSNANVAYPLGTCITFVNDTSAGTLTIAITSDTMILAGAGTTGSRTLAANGIATACKMTSTRWIINGTGLT